LGDAFNVIVGDAFTPTAKYSELARENSRCCHSHHEDRR
jgi:hypothetical protein